MVLPVPALLSQVSLTNNAETWSLFEVTLAALTAEQVSVLTTVNLVTGQCMLGKLSDRSTSPA